ncbi:MAG: glycosyltransferase [Rhabdochlamydiaceae bacterium]
MKLAVADNNGRKFTNDLINHWEALGHEVHVEPGASEKLAQWADIYYCDIWDNNIHYLYGLYNGDPGNSRAWMKDWDNNKKPFIVCRLLDWEVFLGLARDQAMINWVNKAICIAPHIEQKLRAENDWGDKLKLIRPGVNLEKFTLKTKETDGFQLGMVLGDEWKYKNLYGGLDIFTTLYQKDKRWRLHLRGQHENSMYDPVNFDYYLESRGIKDVVTHYSRVEDMNTWYENIDILLHPGQKEAFCYAIGEAMAKGIPCVINDFYGSHAIWPNGHLYKTHEEAINKIKSAIPNSTIRKYIEDNYSLDRMIKEMDEWIGIR